MDKIVVSGVPPLDGEYTVDIIEMITLGSPACLTNQEAHGLKKRTGIRVSEIPTELINVDNDLLIGLAEIALRRAGKRFDPDDLWEATVGAISVEFARRATEDDESPPVEAPPSEPTSEPSRSGGASSNPTSAPHPSDPSPTGFPRSETLTVAPGSVLLTSVT